MFDKVSQAYIDVYDRATNKYLGRHVFKITPEIERALLNFARNENEPNRVVLRDVSFESASDDYIMPLPHERYSRRGIIWGMFRDKYSLQWIPVEIRARFNIMGRAHPEAGQFRFDRIEYSNIVIEGITVTTEPILNFNR